jgi:signal transduction histidine kinase
MTIRTKLAIWYFIVSSLIVLIISFSIFWGMHRLLYRTIDDDLNIFTDMIESSYNPLLGKFEEILWKFESAKRYQEVYLYVYNSRRMVKFASPMTQFINLKMPLPEDDQEVGFTETAKVAGKLSVLSTDDEGNVTFRGISRQMFYNNHPIGWIQAGLPITNVESALNNLLWVIFIINCFAVVLVGAGGYFLIGRFLSPIKLITKKANAISHSNLNERIQIQNEQDELGQLSHTLNNLLERLNKAFESQRSFMADAAHELKTPLAILRTHWENELNNSELNDLFKDQLAQDVETIGRLNQMINKLLFLSQTEDVHDRPELKTLQLDEFLREIINDAKILANLKEQSIDAVELAPLSVKADPNQLYQLFFNLIDNAIKYTPHNGKIWITLRKTDQNAEIKIRDNGIGIEKDNLQFIFDRFYRVDKDRSRKTGGSGLGLSICKMIVDSYKGTITIDSKVGEGTTFTILFPLI